MDLVEWNESEFLSIKDRLHAFVTGPDVRYKSDSVLYVSDVQHLSASLLETKVKSI